jgi:hypothetical protein
MRFIISSLGPSTTGIYVAAQIRCNLSSWGAATMGFKSSLRVGNDGIGEIYPPQIKMNKC